MARPDPEGIETVRFYLEAERTYEEKCAFNAGVRAAQFYVGAWADSEDVPQEIRAVLDRLFHALFRGAGIPSSTIHKPKQIGDSAVQGAT